MVYRVIASCLNIMVLKVFRSHMAHRFNGPVGCIAFGGISTLYYS